MAQAFLDYLRESASNVAQIKSVQSKLREQNLMVPAGGQQAQGAAVGEDNLDSLAAGQSILGKRQRTE